MLGLSAFSLTSWGMGLMLMLMLGLGFAAGLVPVLRYSKSSLSHMLSRY